MDWLEAHCLFCDDIREEADGRSSYMGVFTDAIKVPALPFTLPALAIRVRLLFPLSWPKGDGELSVNLLGKEHRSTIQLGANLPVEPPPGMNSCYTVANLIFRFIQVSEPGVITISYFQDGHGGVLDTIDVVLVPQPV